MRRRDFLAATSAAALAPTLLTSRINGDEAGGCCGQTYATPAEAMQSERETLLYVTALYVGTDETQPDYLAVVDVDPKSADYAKVVHRASMPTPGDELHHFGWNACSSCHGDPTRRRRYLIVPGLRSGRIHVLDAADPRAPKLHKVIERDEIVAQTGLTSPHTVHCLPDGRIMLSMLGDKDSNGPGGFLLLDQKFEIAGHWERKTGGMKFNYDFWYQPRHNVMVSSEWAAPKTVRPGFKVEDVQAGKYGQQIHFWDWEAREIYQTVDMGQEGLIPLEVRFHHNPDSTHGYVGAALSSTMWHWEKGDRDWRVKKVIEVASVEHEGWPFPVPGLITDLVVSLDDKWLYFSNWLHGDIRQYDISDPVRPRLAAQLWVGGVLGKSPQFRGQELAGGPQMLQLSLDGRRLYATNSLYSSWDNQFYPAIKERGSHLLQIDCDTSAGGLKLNDDFFVDFGQEPSGPARAHEMRFPGGDCTSDIWV
jgi:selenium-binding protein 1